MDWLIELGKQAPVLSVLVWVVHRFLTYLETKDKAQAQRDAEQRAVLKEIAGDCHDNQRQSTAATRDVVAALGEIRVTMAKLNGG